MLKTIEKQVVFEQFVKEVRSPPYEKAIYRSFRKWATMRDELIKEYSLRTGIDEEEFSTALALDLAGYVS